MNRTNANGSRSTDDHEPPPSRAGEVGRTLDKRADSDGNQQISHAEGSAQGSAPQKIHPDLQTIIDAWPTVPLTVRAGILAMIRATDVAKEQVL
jgi:hypothetical protein